jgi:hypothetical protein
VRTFQQSFALYLRFIRTYTNNIIHNSGISCLKSLYTFVCCKAKYFIYHTHCYNYSNHISAFHFNTSFSFIHHTNVGLFVVQIANLFRFFLMPRLKFVFQYIPFTRNNITCNFGNNRLWSKLPCP